MANEKGIPLYITLSNAAMLSRELGTHLTGRYKQIVKAVQVCWGINGETMDREIVGIRDAMTGTGAKEGIIITHNQEDSLNGIDLIPAWKWI